jgi:hypothetical protein
VVLAELAKIVCFVNEAIARKSQQFRPCARGSDLARAPATAIDQKVRQGNDLDGCHQWHAKCHVGSLIATLNRTGGPDETVNEFIDFRYFDRGFGRTGNGATIGQG